ncbi:hypothetical protein BC937DRAFT_91393 [Endogone sp. FLAS-F59071]|nr:hypothetical protein BC937DRAFT_91393 [Endogone sp. FLAS-F59071]RUS21803.1 hypothetical protein BC937DRAFT_91393 [Endogone sp. FLAS-F59071]|eukprot:RUS21801.1 hypothetical protein BC937DRAFT_91393 [Endogone sp. FLAS-F59071]
MVEKGNGRELKMLDDVHRMEEEMKKWCEALPADRKAELLSGDEADSDDDDFDPDQSYLIPATRAIVSLNSSVALVHYYCAALPRDSYCNPQPQFDVKPEGNGYICHLTLPSNSPLREVTSELLRSKGMAKRAAALKACILLHQLKALNDHLLPDVENPEEEMEEYRDEKGLLEGSKKRKSHYPKKIPDFWALPEENSVMSLRTLHMTMFKVNLTDDMYEGQEYRTLCLLTRNGFPPIPSFKVYFRSVERTADIVSLMPISLDNDQLDALYRFTMKMCSSIVNRDFVCLLEEIPFLVAPLLSKGQIAPDKDNSELIDWAEIRMGTENYTLPIDPNDLEPLTDAVIIDHADNQRRYFVQRVRRDLNPLSPVPEGVQLRESGYKNFADYYKKVFGLELTLADQPLIEVQIVPKVRNFLQTVPGAAPKQKARVATFVIPEYCRRFPICASVFRSATMLPSLLMRVDAFLAVQELRQAHKLHVDDRLLLEAFTTPSANMEMNYERLETLGDSFLKFVVTIRLYILFPDKHEGQLHSARIRIICNRALYKSAKELRLFERILSMPFNRRLWRPPRFTTKIDDKPEMQETLRAMREHGLSDKTLADVVEASFGAAYLTGGVESALGCCIAMQVPFDQITTWAHFNEAYITDRHKRPARADPKALRTLNVARIEEITGYHFANPLLIAEALTHASLPNSTCPCYQRLEFLGDAILDFLVIRYLFHKYPVAVPGVMTELKDASVNNQILGAICLHIGLHRHVIHFSAKLVGAITQFATAVAKMRERGECTGEYWSELDVPKVLSDVVESMLGAVFVDSGFQIEAVQQVFAKWVEPMLDNHVTPETLKVHPLKTLTTRIQQNGCEGLLLRNHTSSDTDSESQTCTIFIHDHPITRASSNSIRVARKLAAAQANTILDEKPEYLKSVCNCALTRKHRDVDDSEDEDRDGGVGG